MNILLIKIGERVDNPSLLMAWLFNIRGIAEQQMYVTY